jgi:hypothetical protein
MFDVDVQSLDYLKTKEEIVFVIEMPDKGVEFYSIERDIVRGVRLYPRVKNAKESNPKIKTWDKFFNS